MSSLANKIAKFLRSPRGQQFVGKVRQYASRPENQRRIAQLRDRLAAQRKPARRG
jgi:hypothetical protein